MTKLADHLEHVHFIRGYPAKEKIRNLIGRLSRDLRDRHFYDIRL